MIKRLLSRMIQEIMVLQFFEGLTDALEIAKNCLPTSKRPTFEEKIRENVQGLLVHVANFISGLDICCA